LCPLFGAVHVPVEPGYRRPKIRGHHLRAFHMKPPEESPDNVHRNIHYTPVVVLGVLHGFSRNERVAWAKQECFAHGVIAEARLPGSPSLPRPSFNGNLVESSRVNYSQVQTWLTHCRKFHAGSCESLAFVRTTPSKFIDCFTRQVVQSPPAEEYFALSYVWGNPKNSSLDIERRENLHFLPPSGIPQVFEDAIHVVKNLGGRYLWVDRYCIDQQNLDEKHEQIQNMDQIYEGATLTLVAVAGTNADCGLPGVHGLSRIFHPRAVIGDKVLVSTFPHISFPIRESAWTTRGWTYQEAILSRRYLFFTKQQVYFVCRAMTCQEAVETLPYMSIAPPETRAMTTTLSLEIFGHEKPHRSTSRPQVAYLQNFYSNLVQYKRRQLTYDSDSLNAFKGILARSPFHSFWGIPIPTVTSSTDSVFTRGLWWRTKFNNEFPGSLRRRHAFPSWSWAGWAGEIEPGIHNHYTDETQRFAPKFWIEHENLELSTLGSLLKSAGKSKIIPEISRTLLVEAVVVQVRVQKLQRTGLHRDLTPRVLVCGCHVDSLHQSEDEPTHWRHVYLCKDPDQDEEFREKLFTQLWDCIVLFEELGEYKLLIVERQGHVFHLIGTLSLQYRIFGRLLRLRRDIRLE
jgi:hypothetical protein